MNIQETLDHVKMRMEAGETFYDLFPPVKPERSSWVAPSLIPLAFVLGAFAMIAGAIKVKNELEMTKQYARWADASVRQAEALERAYPVPKKDLRYQTIKITGDRFWITYTKE